MNILFLSHQSENVYGGEIVSLEMMLELQKRGHRVILATPAGKLADQADRAGVPVKHIPSMEFSRNIELAPEFVKCWCATHLTLMNLVREKNVQLVHAISLKAMVYGWFGAFFHPVIWHHHNIMKKSLSNRFWLQLLARQASKILVPSAATKDSLVQNGVSESAIEVLYNGFLPTGWTERAARRASDVFTIGYVGEISGRKGVDRLIEAVKQVKQKATTSFQLKIIGEPVNETDFAMRLRLDTEQMDEVQWLGRQDNIRDHYQKFDVVVVPSRQDPLPTVIIEAYFSGVPVLASDVGGIPEMVVDGETGYICRTNQEFADKLMYLMQNEGELHKFGRSARLFAEDRYSVSRVGAELEKIYGKVVR